MLPFVLPCFAIWFSRDGEENDGIERRGRKKKIKEVLGCLLYEASFLPVTPCLPISESGGQDARGSLVNPVNRCYR